MIRKSTVAALFFATSALVQPALAQSVPTPWHPYVNQPNGIAGTDSSGKLSAPVPSSAITSALGYTPVSPPQAVSYPWAGSGFGFSSAPTPAQVGAALSLPQIGGVALPSQLPLVTTGAAGAMQVGTGLGVSSGTVSVQYGTTAGTALQGNQVIPASQTSGLVATANNLSDLANAATARTNLGLGSAATYATGTSGATVPLTNGNNDFSGQIQIPFPVSFSDRVNVMAAPFLAPCNGTANDQAAIQAAINAAANIARVVIPYGAQCRVTGLKLPSNSQLTVNGTLKLLPNSGARVSVVSTNLNASNIVLTVNGVIDGNSSQQTGIGGRSDGFQTPDGGAESNIWVLGTGIIQNTVNSGVHIVQTTGAWIANVTMMNNGNSNGFAVGTNECWAQNVKISNVDDLAFAFYGGVYNCGISGSQITDSLSSGIVVYNDNAQTAEDHDITISNNLVTGMQGNGIASISAGGLGKNYNLSIVGNREYANNLGNTGSDSDIQLTAATRTLVAQNSLGPSGGGTASTNGVYVTNSSYVQIVNNSIYDEGQGGTNGDGINDNLTTNLLISGNHIFDDQGTPTMAHGITGTAAAYTQLVGNLPGPTIGNWDNLTPAATTIVAQQDSLGGPYFLYGHLFSGGPALSASNLSACGSSPSIVGNDTRGTLTEGTTATGCVLTFAAPYAVAPTCTVTSPTGSLATSYSTSPSALTISNASASSDKFSYTCVQ